MSDNKHNSTNIKKQSNKRLANLQEGNNSNTEAYGFIETRGMTAITYALDEMLKASTIKLEGLKRIGSAYITAVVSGSNDDIINAIMVGKEAVKEIEKANPSPATYQDGLCQLISTHVISRSLIDIVNTFINKCPGIRFPENSDSIGLVDARGLIAIIAAADQMTKTAPVDILGYHKMGSGRLNIAIGGELDAVNQAIEVALPIVKKHGKLIGSNVLSNPDKGLKLMLS